MKNNQDTLVKGDLRECYGSGLPQNFTKSTPCADAFGVGFVTLGQAGMRARRSSHIWPNTGPGIQLPLNDHGE